MRGLGIKEDECNEIEYSSEKSRNGFIKRTTIKGGGWRGRGNKFLLVEGKGRHVKGDCFQLSLVGLEK